MKEMTIEEFGKLMDDIIKETKVQLFVTIPEDSMDVDIADNLGLGAVIQLYILIHAFEKVLTDLIEPDIFGLDPDRISNVLDGIFELVRKDVVQAVTGGNDETD